MKTLSKMVIGAVAGVGIALAAVTYAQGPGFGYGPGGYGPGMGMHGQGFGGPGAMGAGLDSLKSELKLTGKQTKAWDAYETAVRGQTQAMLAAHGQMQAAAQNPDVHIAFMEQRLAGMKAVQKARTDLYNVLTPEQKAIADRYACRGPRI
jgi:Spy/CpxP family protein refolding chaperone